MADQAVETVRDDFTTEDRQFAVSMAERLRGGDESALLELHARWALRTDKWLRRSFGGLLKAFEHEDVFWEALEHLWNTRARIEPNGRLQAYFRRIVHNVAADRVKASWHKQCLNEGGLDPQVLATLQQFSSRPKRTRVPKHVVEALHNVISVLPFRQRAVVEADAQATSGFGSSLSLADELGTTEAYVRTLRRRAYEKIRRRLSDLGLRDSARCNTNM